MVDSPDMLKFDLVIQKASPRHRAAIIANHAAITPADCSYTFKKKYGPSIILKAFSTRAITPYIRLAATGQMIIHRGSFSVLSKKRRDITDNCADD